MIYMNYPFQESLLKDSSDFSNGEDELVVESYNNSETDQEYESRDEVVPNTGNHDKSENNTTNNDPVNNIPGQ